MAKYKDFIGEQEFVDTMERVKGSGTYQELDFKIKSSDADYFNRAQARAIFSLLEEVASAHVDNMGLDKPTMDSKGVTWILNGVNLRIKRLPTPNEEARIYSWQSSQNRVGVRRDYYAFDLDGEPLFYASSFCTIASIEKHKIESPELLFNGPNPYIIDVSVVDGRLNKLRSNFADFSDDSKVQSTIEIISYSDLDHNHHVNNTKYLDYARDAADTFDPGGDLIALDITYAAELHRGDLVIVDATKVAEDEDTVTIAVRAQVEDNLKEATENGSHLVAIYKELIGKGHDLTSESRSKKNYKDSFRVEMVFSKA